MARPRKNAAEVQDILLTPDESAIIPVEEQPYPLPEGWKWVKGSSLLGPQESQKPTGDFFYCPTQGGVKPPPLGGGFSVSFVVCGHEQLS